MLSAHCKNSFALNLVKSKAGDEQGHINIWTQELSLTFEDAELLLTGKVPRISYYTVQIGMDDTF